MVQPLWRIVWNFLKTVKNRACNPTQGIYPEKNMIRKDACTPVFTAVLFAIAKIWQQSKCPLIEEWIRCGRYIQCYSTIKNNAICSNMDGPRDYHTKWSKSDREGEILYDILYMWNLKTNDTNELTKQKETRKLREWTYSCKGEGWGEGIARGFGMNMYTLLYLRWVTNKDLLSSTWNSAQCYMAAWMKGEFWGEWIHVYAWVSPFTAHLKLSQYCLPQ